MTHYTENKGPMRLLTKVARGLDLQPFTPTWGTAYLAGEGNPEEALFYPTERASESAGGSLVKDVSQGVQNRNSEKTHTSEPPIDPLPKLKNTIKSDKIKSTPISGEGALEVSQGHGSIGDSLEYVASDNESVILKQPSSIPVSQNNGKEKSTRQGEEMQGHNKPQQLEDSNGYVNRAQVPKTEWHYLNAENFKDNSRKQIPQMLRPVFQTPGNDTGNKPSKNFQTSSDKKESRAEISQSVNHTGPPVKVKKDTPGEKEGTKDQVIHEKVFIKPATAFQNNKKPISLSKTGKIADEEKMLFSKKNEITPTKEIGTSIRRVNAPLQTGQVIKNNLNSPAVPKKNQKKRAGKVTIGRINIHVRGKLRTEEEWPAPPQYSPHEITEDWEWSCLYGK